jgi:hypothetical protein
MAVFESSTAGITIQAPQLDINTVGCLLALADDGAGGCGRRINSIIQLWHVYGGTKVCRSE